MRTMLIEKLRRAAIVALVLAVFGGAGAGWLLFPTDAAQQAPVPQPKKVDAAVPQAAGAAQDKDALVQLKKNLVEAAKKTYEMDLKRFQALQLADPQSLCQWSRRWLDARLDLARGKDERLTAYREHLDRMRTVERMAKSYYMTGQGRMSDATGAEYCRIQAEIWLAQAKAK